MHTHRKGFTIIELLVVIAMIAIVAAMILPAVSHVRNRKNAATQTVDRSDPRQSPIAPIAAPAPAAQNAYTLQFNDPQAYDYAKRLLVNAKLQVQALDGKSSLVFDPEGTSTNLHWTKMQSN